MECYFRLFEVYKSQRGIAAVTIPFLDATDVLNRITIFIELKTHNKWTFGANDLVLNAKAVLLFCLKFRYRNLVHSFQPVKLPNR